MESRIDLESVDLSVEALDNLLSNEFVIVESEDPLLRHILKLGLDYRDLLRHTEIGFLSEDGLSLLDEDLVIPSESVWHCAIERITQLLPLFDSQIISDFPEIFAEFRKNQISILWRDSRDGFKAKEFHRRCDGHANTLTVILDTKGNKFGGFTPMEWESRTSNPFTKADDSLKCFIFTPKNPHNIPARRFALKTEKKHQAIECRFEYGPRFVGDVSDMGVYDNCNAKANSFTSFGISYTNDTGLDEKMIFTGLENFQVKEIEVFEITG
jgi:hypothetical protein